jgi:hypothetical protein
VQAAPAHLPPFSIQLHFNGQLSCRCLLTWAEMAGRKRLVVGCLARGSRLQPTPSLPCYNS